LHQTLFIAWLRSFVEYEIYSSSSLAISVEKMNFSEVLQRFNISRSRVGDAYEAVVSYLESVEKYIYSDAAQRKLREICPLFDSLNDKDKEVVLVALAFALYGMCNRNAIDMPECDEIRKLGMVFYNQLFALAVAKKFNFRKSRKLKSSIGRILDYATKICAAEKHKGVLARIKSLFSR